MVVAAANMLEVVNMARRLAPSTIPVLITGETGTGKELLARALHDASPRKDKPFIPFNCTAVSRDLLDAQLFGYRRGAFTGAQEAFPGVIRAAAGGTLFLDEIGELTLDVQPKLLRFLESNEIHPARRAQADPRRRPRRRRHQRQPRAAGRATDASAKTSSTASTSSACRSRRCASAARRFRSWSSTTSRSSAASRKRPAFASRKTRWST